MRSLTRPIVLLVFFFSWIINISQVFSKKVSRKMAPKIDEDIEFRWYLVHDVKNFWNNILQIGRWLFFFYFECTSVCRNIDFEFYYVYQSGINKFLIEIPHFMHILCILRKIPGVICWKKRIFTKQFSTRSIRVSGFRKISWLTISFLSPPYNRLWDLFMHSQLRNDRHQGFEWTG